VVPLKRHPVHIDDQSSEGIIKNTFLDFNICFGLGEAKKGGFKAPVSPGEPIEDQKAVRRKVAGQKWRWEKKVDTDSFQRL